jgi:glucose uptake protein
MILPGSYLFTIFILTLGLLCWGAWANTFKAVGKWRFELYCFDFAIGVFLAALLAALTVGSMGWDGFSFLDDVRNAGKRQDLFAFLAGAMFNLGNMLLLGAISLTGLSVALPVGAGLGLVVAVIWSYSSHPAGSPVFLGLGSLSIVIASGLAAAAFWIHSEAVKKEEAASPSPLKGKRAKKASPLKGLIIAVIAGLVLGSFHPLVELAQDVNTGLGPYALAFVFALGVITTTFVYNLFLMNLPLQGNPLDLGEYLKGNARQHVLGIAGGAMWSIGSVASLVAARAEGAAQAGPVLNYAMSQSAPLLTILCGLFYWKEFSEAEGPVKTMFFIMLVFLATGIAAVSSAPLFGSIR